MSSTIRPEARAKHRLREVQPWMLMLALLPALMLALTLGACSRERGAEPGPLPDVVLVTFDTLRADHLGFAGYFRETSPNLDALARASVVFERCIAPMATTLPVHASILTGVQPQEHGLLGNVDPEGRRYELSDELPTFTQFLRGNGYRTAAFVSALPLKRQFGLDGGFEVYDEPSGRERRAGETTDAALAWYTARQAESAPLFLWVHYFDPHGPYEPPAEFAQAFGSDGEIERYLAERRFADAGQRPGRQAREVSTRASIDLYDGEILYMDREVGRLFAALQAGPRWERTALAAIADHGEGLNQHGEPGHGQVWNEQLHVPFLLRVPGLEPRRVGRLVTPADLVPTLLGAIEIPGSESLLARMSGLDALAPDFPAERQVLSQTSERQVGLGRVPAHSLTGERWKFVRHADGREQLFDLGQDPFELRDVAPEQTARMAELRATLEAELAAQRSRAPRGPERSELGTGELEGLRELGYIGD